MCVCVCVRHVCVHRFACAPLFLNCDRNNHNLILVCRIACVSVSVECAFMCLLYCIITCNLISPTTCTYHQPLQDSFTSPKFVSYEKIKYFWIVFVCLNNLWIVLPSYICYKAYTELKTLCERGERVMEGEKKKE